MNLEQQHTLQIGKAEATFRVFADADTLSRATAQYITESANEAVQLRGRFLLVLTGGGTPIRTYELLASAYKTRMPWDNVHLFWGDERYVPEDHKESNQRAAREAFIDEVPIPPEQVYPVPTHHATPLKAAEAYEALVRDVLSTGDTEEAPLFDLVLLGMGGDGHIASLFPGHIDPEEAERPTNEGPWVRAVTAPPHAPVHQRVTLTFAALNHTRNTAFLVSGERKRKALRTLIDEHPGPQEAPAQLIHPQERLTWFVDAGAFGR